jgi:hypothetical protein
MKYKEVDGERGCTCPPKCDECDERFTCQVMVQLTCETEGLGTITWQETAQQFLREFTTEQKHAERQRSVPTASF